MSEALANLRILDLTQGPAGGLATMILADFGAEVIHIARPDDPFDALPAAPMWLRGKQNLALDLAQAADRGEFDSLCAAADVLVTTWRPAKLRARSLDYDHLHAACPHLIYCHITGFGSHGPLSNLPGYEHVIAAYTGRMQLFQGLVDRSGPVFSALQVGIHACAQSATTGILAAVHERNGHGHGRLIETSLLQGMLPYEQGAMLATQFHKSHPELVPVKPVIPPDPPMPSLYYHPAQAGDGRWMQFGNLLPHLFDNFLIATDLIDVVTDEDFDPKQLLLTDPTKHEAFRDRMLERIQDKPAQAWLDILIEDGGIVGTIYQTTQQAMEDPDIVANGHAVIVGDSVQLGPVAALTKTPARIGGDSDIDFRANWLGSPRPVPHGAGSTAQPLAGIRVLELATIIAAPLGASYLADLGADVIKVEQIGGDPFRSMLSGIGSARVNAGKRSLSIDLKSEQGRQHVLSLAAQADILIHNFRPGVPERLGIGYEQIAKLNPQIVYLQSNGYGPHGPGAHRPSTHPVPGAAMGGVMYQMHEHLPADLQDNAGLRLWTRRLMRANEVNPDPNTALVIATSALLGLVARDRTGTGQQVLVDMFGANAYANHDDFVKYRDKRPRALADPLGHGLHATYRLYACAEQQWLFCAVLTASDRANFASVARQYGSDIELPADLFTNETATADYLSELFSRQTADIWQAAGVAAGIALVRADALPPQEFWLHDPQAQSIGLTQPVTHPRWGHYQRHGAMVLFDGRSADLQPPPLAGQHNREILRSAGLSDNEIQDLANARVIWEEPR